MPTRPDAFHLGRFYISNLISLVLLGLSNFLHLNQLFAPFVYAFKRTDIKFIISYFLLNLCCILLLCSLCHFKYCLFLPSICFLNQSCQRFVDVIYLFKEPVWLCWYSYHMQHYISLGFTFSFIVFFPQLFCVSCVIFISFKVKCLEYIFSTFFNFLLSGHSFNFTFTYVVIWLMTFSHYRLCSPWIWGRFHSFAITSYPTFSTVPHSS